MIRIIASAAVAIACLLLTALPAAASNSAAAAEWSTADFLIGTWNCSHTFGDDGGTYRTTYERTLEGAWIKQLYDFGATKTESAKRAEFLIGYDADWKHWIRFGALSDGLYFALVATRSGDVWSWSYVLPGRSSAPETFFTKRSANEYTVDGPTYPHNGKLVTEHHKCRKNA